MKAIVRVKNENGLVYELERNSIKEAIDYAKESVKVAFDCPAFENAKRKEIFVNVKSTHVNEFVCFLIR